MKTMLWGKEYGYNACERNGTLESCELFEKRLRMLKNSHFLDRNEEYNWIYLGFEFCENMMKLCRIEHLERKIAMADAEGYKVAFVFPPMYQKSVLLWKEWIWHLSEQRLVREWIVNDLGTFVLLEEARVRDGLVLGRLFEKAVREVRQNILEIPEVEKYFEIFQPGESVKSIIEILGKKYPLCGAEVDTFPDGVLSLADHGLEYRVHYPDIFLSYSPYCEYANVDHEEKGCFILHQPCVAECCLYEQKISTSNGRDIYKTGNVMIYRQSKNLEKCIEGCCRVVYSDRIYMKYQSGVGK